MILNLVDGLALTAIRGGVLVWFHSALLNHCAVAWKMIFTQSREGRRKAQRSKLAHYPIRVSNCGW
jgi:hypothetical protein